jgi:hypothetical protein|tara:strand:- start:665 stop:1789 length:1125 start_codon:yes stop_codon:yes gene_type:complete
MASLGNADTTGFSEEQISGMRGFSSVTEMNEYDAKKREEVKNENGNVKTDSYDTTGGLPATLRYPNTALDDSMDFLVIRISDFVPAGLNLSGLVSVDDKETEDKSDDVVSAGADLLDETKTPFSLTTASSKNKKQKAKHTIYLPIPRQVQDANNVQYGNGTLNPLEAIGTGLVAGALDNPSLQQIRDSFGLIIQGGADVIAKNQDAIGAAIAGRAIGAFGGNVTPNQLIARASGQILNPNLELLFEGVQLRVFPFQFEFFPRNYDEAQQVKKIIRVLKRSMASKKGQGGKGIFIKQPDIFQLEYKKGSEPHPFLNKFLPAHLTNMKVNYTQSGNYSTFYDGTPTHISVQCSFTEVNPVYQEDYDGEDAGEGVGY